VGLRSIGIVLTTFGIMFSLFSYFILSSIPLTSLGLSVLTLGLVLTFTGGKKHALTPEASRVMLMSGVEGISALIDELSLSLKAIYIPSSMGGVKALLPIREGEVKGKIPSGFIVRYGKNPEDVGIAISTPGRIVKVLKEKPKPDNLTSSLSYILVDILNIASSASVKAGDVFEIYVRKPKIEPQGTKYERLVGSPFASISASLIAEAIDRPVRVEEEVRDKGGIRIKIRAL